MKVAPLDIETTTYNYGNAFDFRNEVCFVGLGDKVWEIAYSDEPYGNKLVEIQKEIDELDLIILLNAKFDLHHLMNLRIKFNHKKIWDVQLVDFMLSGQTESYPSMNSMAEKYGLPMKPDIKARYWENDIDTKDIPREEIVSYLKDHDLVTTLAIYNIQKELVKAKGIVFERLVSLHNQDLLVLQEIEYNGLRFDEQACLQQATELTKTIEELRMELHDYHNLEEFNTESGDHLSCLLYGGDIVVARKELIGVYKTGYKKGLDKYGWKEYTYTLPRLVNPLPKTELKKPGYWQTGEDVLKSLKTRDKAAKRVITVILELAKLEKIVNGYYVGLPKLREKMHWKFGYLHGNLNQCVARTGRLSSTRPNLQNLAGEMKDVFVTRF